MKRLLVVLLAVVVGLVFVTGLYAQSMTDKATKAATDAKTTATGDTLKDKATKAVSEKTATAPAPDKKAEAPAAPGKPAGKETGPCKQIAEICKNAGFVYGEWKDGEGLYRDCVNPIMKGKTKVPGATKPLPAVDPKLVAECKAKNPDFGSGKVGSKPKQ